MFSHCNWICASRKHIMYGSLRCFKNLYFHNCWNPFFVPKLLWNSDKKKLLNFRIDFFYCSVISPFTINLFLLPFSSHCSTQNIGFSDFGYVIKPPLPSYTIYRAPPFTGHCQNGCFWNSYGQNHKMFNYGNFHIDRCLKLFGRQYIFCYKMWFYRRSFHLKTAIFAANLKLLITTCFYLS